MPRAHRKDFIRSATTTLSPRRSSSHLSCAFTTTSPRASVSQSLRLSLSRSRPHPLFELRSVQPEAPQQIRVVFVPLPVEIPRAISRVGAPWLQRVAVARRRVAEKRRRAERRRGSGAPGGTGAGRRAPHVVPRAPAAEQTEPETAAKRRAHWRPPGAHPRLRNCAHPRPRDCPDPHPRGRSTAAAAAAAASVVRRARVKRRRRRVRRRSRGARSERELLGRGR